MICRSSIKILEIGIKELTLRAIKQQATMFLLNAIKSEDSTIGAEE